MDSLNQISKLDVDTNIHSATAVHLRPVVNATDGVVARTGNDDGPITTRQRCDVSMGQPAASGDDRRSTSHHRPIRAMDDRRAPNPVNLGHCNGRIG